MKKIIHIAIATILIISLSACMVNTKGKAIEQGKLSMANGNYESAANSFKLAILEGSNNREVKALYEIISTYIESKEAYDSGNIDKAKRKISEIDSEYKSYIIKKDVEKLQDNIDTAVTSAEAIDRISQYISMDMYAEARVAIDSLDQSKLTDVQKAEVDTLENTLSTKVSTAKTASQLTQTMVYYIPQYYDGLVPSYTGNYLFPSDIQYITNDYMNRCSKNEIALIRNEIYARHGYVFQKPEYISYFNSKFWYVKNRNFNESMLNSIEKENVQRIKSFESSKGW